MRILPTSAVALSAALLLGLAGTSPTFAKAHDQGRTNPARDDASPGDPSRTSPGVPGTATSDFVSDGFGQARSDAAKDRSDPAHDRSDNAPPR